MFKLSAREDLVCSDDERQKRLVQYCIIMVRAEAHFASVADNMPRRPLAADGIR